MNPYPISKVTRLFLAGMLIVGLFVVQAAGQPGKKPDPTKKADVHHPAVNVTVKHDESTAKVHKKAPIDHKPHRAIDPMTKKEIPGTHMMTLPNGNKLRVDALMANLNALEKRLNAHGHTLHDAAAEPKTVTLVTTRAPIAQMNAKAKAISAHHAPHNPRMKAAPRRAALATAHQDAAKKDRGRIAAVTKQLANAAGKNPAGPNGTKKDWQFELGHRNLVAGVMAGKLEVQANQSGVSIHGEGEAGAYLMNQHIPLLKASATAKSPTSGAPTAQLSVTVFGQTIYNKNFPITTTQEFSRSIDKSVSFRYEIGPIPMSVKLGATGTVGVRFFLGLRTMAVDAQIVPHVNVQAYLQAGIDMVIASAGVAGRMTLVNCEVRIGGSVSLHANSSRGLQFEEQVYVQSNLEMLSGKLAVFAEVYVPAWALPPWKKKHFEWDLWNWQGLKQSGYIVQVTRTQDLPL